MIFVHLSSLDFRLRLSRKLSMGSRTRTRVRIRATRRTIIQARGGKKNRTWRKEARSHSFQRERGNDKTDRSTFVYTQHVRSVVITMSSMS